MMRYLLIVLAVVFAATIYQNVQTPSAPKTTVAMTCPEDDLKHDLVKVREYERSDRAVDNGAAMILFAMAASSPMPTADFRHEQGLARIGHEIVVNHLTGSEVNDRTNAVCAEYYYGRK